MMAKAMRLMSLLHENDNFRISAHAWFNTTVEHSSLTALVICPTFQFTWCSMMQQNLCSLPAAHEGNSPEYFDWVCIVGCSLNDECF